MDNETANQLSQRVEREVRHQLGDLMMQTIVLKQMLEMGQPQEQPVPQPHPPQPNPTPQPRPPGQPGPSPDIPPPNPNRSPVPDPAHGKSLNGGAR